MNTFWAIGIVLNVSLTSLAIWWVLKQMKPKGEARAAKEEREKNS